MNKIIIDFGNIIEELKNKQVKLCLLHNRTGWFIIDKQDKLYQNEIYYDGGFLDKFIKEKLRIEFNLVPISVSTNIGEWEKHIWEIEEVDEFIKRQSKFWY